VASDTGPREDAANLTPADVVGPICESGDFLAKGRPLPEVSPGAVLAVFSTGAYGMTMSSNYNARPRAAEVLIQGGRSRLCGRRESYDDLIAREKGLAVD
jgi:diaminopimelate decarboxylase